MGTASATSEQNRRDYNQAVDLLDRAITAEGRQEAQDNWDRALILAGLCRTRDESNDDFNYLLGYVYYKAPTKTEQIWREAERFLRRATHLNSKHQLARYYLACVLFDRRRYSESLAELNRLPEDAFVHTGQTWRIIKVHELRLCCALYIEPATVAPDETEKLCERYQLFEKDPLLAPLPTELAECLDSVLRGQIATPGLVRLSRGCGKIFDLLRAGDLIEIRWPLLSTVSKGDRP
jgi:hypothetical protein